MVAPRHRSPIPRVTAAPFGQAGSRISSGYARPGWLLWLWLSRAAGGGDWAAQRAPSQGGDPGGERRGRLAGPGGPGGTAVGLVSCPAVPGPGWAPGPGAAAARESAGPDRRPTPPPPPAAPTARRRRARSAAALRSPARPAAPTGARAGEQPAAPRPGQSRTPRGPGGQGEGLKGPGEPVTGWAPDHRAVEGPVG